nr:hypothetical protein JVH1_6052 [Rhodococcus sp. JVH1]
MRAALWARVIVRFPVWSRMRTRVGTTRGNVRRTTLSAPSCRSRVSRFTASVR